MEKFLKVKNGSKIDNEIGMHNDIQRKHFEFMKVFLADNEIEAQEYYVHQSLGIVGLTENDMAKFGNQLKKDGEWFRANSKLNKAYIKGLDDNFIDTSKLRSLTTWDFGIRVYGRSRIQHFKGLDNYYLMIDASNDFKTPEDYEEIKASEWHKAFEDVKEDKV